MAKRRKPHDPGAVTTANLERREREQEIARLKAQGADVTIDRGGRVVSARRSNVFTLLLSRGSITPNQHDAAYRLAQDWATWKGLDGRPEPRMEFVCGSSAMEEAEAGFVSAKRREEGGKRVWQALVAIGHERSHLLEAFMEATVEEDRPMAWRGIVQKATGCAVRDRQTQLVVDSLEALRVVYEQPQQRKAA